MYTRMVRAFDGIGSVVAPDSALVGVAGTVATPSAAACLRLQLTTGQCNLSPRSLTGNAARSSRYLLQRDPCLSQQQCPVRSLPRAGSSTSQRYLLTVSDTDTHTLERKSGCKTSEVRRLRM